ncbi:hypothetical protein R1sor_017150 [Riccia sorocarpa]|uniref:Uncharacterized protein n=1 Tax=Riccia sorocarpa TaxID=122646 RepID=A0ABD3I6D6_9MARC
MEARGVEVVGRRGQREKKAVRMIALIRMFIRLITKDIESPGNFIPFLGPNMVLANVSDSCCSSNGPGCCDSSSFARQSQLYQQLQELRLQFLADLWDILGKFKLRLDNHFDDAAVRFLIQQHIDILQRMIAPMVAQKQMLASWLTDPVLHQLRRQIIRYVDTFKGEKFQISFDRLIAWTASGTRVYFAHTKADCDNERPANHFVKSPPSEYEQREVEPEQNPLKRKTTSTGHAHAPGTSIKPVVATYGVVKPGGNHRKSWIQGCSIFSAQADESSCRRKRLRRLNSTEGNM